MSKVYELIAGLQKRDVRLWVDGEYLRFDAPTGALTADDAVQLKFHKASVIELLKQSAAVDKTVPLVKRPHMDSAPLSYAQQRLWFLAQIEQSSANYNVPLALRLKGKLNQSALLRSIETIVDRHEVLRTRFVESAFGVAQQIRPPGEFHVTVEQYDSTRATLAEMCAAEASGEFDLSCDSLIRARLVELAEDDHVLLVTMHHSVTDGWSMTVFFRELVALYEAYEAGRASPLAPLKIQYADFAHWQRQWLSGEVLKGQQGYWREQLAGIEPVLALPTDRARPAVKTYAGAVQRFQFSKALLAQLKQLSQAQGVTLYMTLLAGFQVLLSRYSNQTDIAVGSPIANRPRAELEELIGFFVNTLVMRTDLSGSPSFVELLQRVKQVALGAYAHQDLPFEQLVELLQPQRSLSYTPFFQVMFTLQNLPSLAGRATQMEIVPLEQASRAAKFDLSVSMFESEQGLQGEVEYNSDLFDAPTLERLIRHYEQLLSAVVTAPQQEITRYDLLSAAERQQLLVEWNDTASAYPTEKCVHELFEEQVRRGPDAVAVVIENERLTYGELNSKANQVAHYLRRHGFGPESLIAICVERSLEMIVGLLGILKAGGAYVPLDPNYPKERLKFMLRDAACGVVLTQGCLKAALSGTAATLVALDDDWAEIEKNEATNIDPVGLGLTSRHLANVIYTSGSTGLPKGVMIEHRHLGHLVHWHCVAFELRSSHRCSSVAAFGFDAATWEIFPALCAGATLALPSANASRDPRALLAWWRSQRLDISFLPTPIAELAFSSGIDHASLTTLLVGGDRLRFLPKGPASFSLVNNYGPTECTVVATSGRLQSSDAVLHIGRPISNTQIYILDAHLKPVPIGVGGEIYIAGAGVARGYLHRPELTAERFLRDPFGADPSARMYKTGDLARWRRDGNVEYIGRNDHQVKIRGYRIELGEIESRLLSHPGVQFCVVLAREDVPGNKRLVAYYTQGEQPVDVEALRCALRSGLPDYMVPCAYVLLEAIPLTPNGKLDRNALPAPDLSALSLKLYEAPLGETEARLAAIWQSLLAVERVGRHDNFFELGGHSLLATSVMSQVRQSFSVDLPLRTLFEHTTLGTFAAAIASAVDQRSVLREVPLVVLDRTQELPLSYAQQRLWFLAQLEQGSANYNVPLALRLKGKLNQSALLRSIETIVDRHEVLRTRFVESAAGVAQQIRPPGEFHVIVEQYDSTRATIAEMCAAEASHEFDLSAESLIRVRLLQLAPEEHVLLITIHHSVTDGWSMSVFFRELVALYEAYEAGRASPLAPLKIQYADFAHWQRQWLSGDVLAVQQAYWREQLTGIEPVLALPTDRARPAVKTYAGAVQRFRFSAVLQVQLNQLSQAQGVTLYMTLLAGFQVLLSRYSHQTDIAVGSPIANRSRVELEELIGFFVNTLVMRTDLSGSPTFVELLQRVKQVALGAYAHQDLPFEQLVELLQPQRSLSYTPFFQVMFTLQNLPSLAVSASDMTISPLEQASRAAKFDLSVSMFESEQGLQGEVEYNSDLFDAPTVERLVRHYERLLTAIIAAPAEKISLYDLLSAEERQQLLVEWNDTACAYPQDKCLQELFAEQVERTPNAVAVSYEDEQLTYAQLDRKANQLAHYLIERGVKPDTVVGLCLERSLEMIVGLLGIIKAGGAYVPLDPNYPAERIEYMLADCGTPVLLTQQALVGQLPAFKGEVICLDSGWEAIARQSDGAPSVAVAAHHLAYVIYTSGSTGAPKGVMNQHDGVVNQLLWRQAQYGLTASDVVLQKTSFSFDVSVWEFFWPLMVGARMVFARPEGHKDDQYLIELIKRHQVSTMHFVPSMLSVMLGAPQFAECSSLKRVFCGGEALSAEHVRQFLQRLPRTELHNLYGPTEAAIDVTYWPCVYHSGLRTVPIGKPVANTQLYVLDEQLEPVPVGVSGELYIGGVQLARGYLHQEELTARSFIANPLSGTPGARLYKTGDVVRYLADGNIEYQGRRDHQVKIRGFRIELGEIEARLLKFAGVQSCVVLVREDVPGNKRLVAYYTQGESEAVQVEALRDALRSGLPDYMVPSAYVLLEAIPLTPNGKVDRRALPAPEADAYGRMAYEAPQGEIEGKLAEIWRELLHVDRISRQDNFFALGGHSLLATRVMSQVRRSFSVELPLRTLFEHTTLGTFAAAIASAVDQRSVLREVPLVVLDRTQELPLSYAQQRLWFLAQLERSSANYNVPLALQLKGRLNPAALLRSIETIVDRHEVLRTRFVESAAGVAQQIRPLGEFHVIVEQYDSTRATIAEMCAAEASHEFDLSAESLIRVRLLQLAPEEHVLLITIHHSVTDGWSMTVFFRELVALYEAYEAGRASPLAPLKIQYADFAHWQRQWLSGEVLKGQQGYWREQLAGIEPVLALPTDRARPAVKTYAGAVQRFHFSKALLAQLKQLSQAQGVTLYMTLLAGFQVLLSRYSNQTDIAVGSPIANRPRAELEELIGFFVNTLVMRTDLSGSPSFVELLQRVKQVALGAYAHQDLPFEQLVELLQPQRSLSYTPFFQVMFTLQNLPSFAASAVSAVQMTISPLEQASRAAKFDLTVSMFESEQGLQGEVEYNSDLFDAPTVERLIRHYEQLLSAVVTAPQQQITRYDLLSAEERQQLLVEWNDTACAYPRDKCLQELFAEQVERTPQAIAVEYEGEALSYRALNERANQLAHYLIERGVKPDTVVGLCLERSLEMIVGLLGIIKAGGAYAPLDPNYPAERIEYMLQDCGAPLVLSQQALVEKFKASSVEWLALDNREVHARHMARQPTTNISRAQLGSTPEHLVHVIYTSGSTGAPKGVMVEQRGVVRLVCGTNFVELNAQVVMLQQTTLGFDVSAFEIWGALLNGGRLVVYGGDVMDIPRMMATVSRTGVNTIALTPSLLQVWLDQYAQATPSVKTLVVAGEALAVASVVRMYRLNPQLQIIDAYGPTENSVYSVAYRVPKTIQSGDIKPIGLPIAQSSAYVVDAQQRLVPVGCVGELYVGGAGVARGYLNQPQLTAEKFIKDPFSDQAGARLYRSGDLVRRLADGNIEYLGRRDHQVKIRGFRIELGEIEARLLKFAGVQSCVVLAREDVPGDKRLVAYYTQGEQPVEVEALRSALRSGLPDYMVPSGYVLLEAIPMTPNGKIDRRALPAPDADAYGRMAYEAPQGPIEERLAGIWQELLHVDRISRQADFFELGGHSLLATSVMSQVRKSFGVELALRTLFEHATLSAFAAAIASTADQHLVLTDVPLVVADRGQELPLSYAQQRLWFLAQLERSSANYNVPLALRLKGKLNQSALLRSIETIVDRHEVLRTRFVESAFGVAQQIRPPGEFHVIVEQYDSTRATIAEMCAAEASGEFDLSCDSLIRARLVELAEDDHVLLVTMHHSVTDGWSMTVFFRELVALYEAYEAGRASPLPPLKIQYADFAHWQRQWLSGDVLAVQQAYWREQLAGIEPVLALPTDRARPAVKTYAGAVQRFQFSKALLAQLNQLSQAQGVTLYMTLLAGFQVLLSRYSNQTDIAVGSPIANRPRAELEELIGFFVNTLVMRTDLSGSPTFVELLQRVKQVALGAYAHQDLPFEQLVELLQPQRSLSYTPFFQVMFTLQNLPSLAVSASDMTISPLEQASRAAKFDLSVSMFESEQGLQGEVEYNSDLFDAPTVERLIRHYEQLLSAVVTAPQQQITRYDLLSAEERQQLLVEWNDTAAAYPQDKCLQELFAEQVERTPNAVAVSYEDEQLTYAQLDRKANQLAHYLIKRGVGSDIVVGIIVERSLEMLVGLLGILKAGGAYVPLDPNYPAERIEYMLADCGTPVLLTQQALVGQLPAFKGEVICLDSGWEAIAQQSDGAPNVAVAAHHLAYVIYTSGSTGAPKGVMVEQRGVVRLVCGTNFVELNAQVVMLQQTTLGFDVSAFEIWGALLNGGRLVVYGGDVMDIPRMMATVSRTGVNTIALTPSLLQVWLDQYAQATPSVKTLVVAGEALAVASVVRMYRLNPQLQIIDAYGPTENSVYSVAYRVPKTIQSGDIKPIGLPIAQSSAYVVDAQQRLVPVGCVGELYVGGAGVARGYLNQPQLTAEKFIKDPFSDQAGARLYRSGDLVRRLADGNIEYLGRRDHQVKIRGFRIELGEIEARLLKFAGVQSCVVLAREDVPGDKRLVAYYTQGEQPVEVEALRSALRSGLPDYMVPSGYVLLEAIPMTPNGKIDRRALPAPDADAYGRMAYEAPQGEIEEAIAKVWQELLHVAQIGRHDNFFELGGHSLLAMRIRAAFNKEFSVDVPLIEFMQASSLRDLALVVAGYLQKSKHDADEVLQQIRLIEALSVEELNEIARN